MSDDSGGSEDLIDSRIFFCEVCNLCEVLFEELAVEYYAAFKYCRIEFRIGDDVLDVTLHAVTPELVYVAVAAGHEPAVDRISCIGIVTGGPCVVWPAVIHRSSCEDEAVH